MKATEIPGWRWLPGMRTCNGEIVFAVFAGGLNVVVEDGCGGRLATVTHDDGPIPDLDDPATGGAMLALLGDKAWRVAPSAKESGGFRALVGASGIPEHHPTLSRACLAVAVSLGRWPGVREV